MLSGNPDYIKINIMHCDDLIDSIGSDLVGLVESQACRRLKRFRTVPGATGDVARMEPRGNTCSH